MGWAQPKDGDNRGQELARSLALSLSTLLSLALSRLLSLSLALYVSLPLSIALYRSLSHPLALLLSSKCTHDIISESDLISSK